MIPSAFEYHRPPSVAEAIRIVSERGDDARVIAGGHSLIPMMKLRMAYLEHLVDLQDVAELKELSIADGIVRIGAMVTQHELITHEGLAQAVFAELGIEKVSGIGAVPTTAPVGDTASSSDAAADAEAEALLARLTAL